MRKSTVALHRTGWVGLSLLTALPLGATAPGVGSISIVVGAKTGGFGPDGGTATTTRLWNPGGLALDAAGDLFVADTWNHRVEKVAANGTVTTVAGSGRVGPSSGTFSGDGGPAIEASLNWPTDVAVDRDGDFYIADFHNRRVRRVSASGTIGTVAGSAPPGLSGGGARTAKLALEGPHGIAVDNLGNLFIADMHGDRVYKVSPNGTIATVAGGGSTGIGDGGPAAAARLAMPSAVAIDDAGSLFIADQNHHRVRKVSAGGVITTLAGTGEPGFSGDGGPASKARLRFPSALALDCAGCLFVVDSGNHRIRKVSREGAIMTVAGGGVEGLSVGVSATSVGLDPHGVAVDREGNLLITASSDQVLKVYGVAAAAAPGNPVAHAGGN